MKILEWLGWNNEASPYLMVPGELRSLVNLQPSRRGMLITRAGMSKVYGQQDGDMIAGLYRKITPFGFSDVLLAFQKTARLAQDTDEEDTPVWRVVRLTSNPFQSQVIDEQPLSPNSSTLITNMSVAEDRHGRLFIFYGHGAKPILYRPTLLGNLGVEMGLTAPTAQPTVTPEGEGYFIERVDVTGGGGSYWAAPSMTLVGGTPEREGRLKAVVQGGNLVSVDVVDGGVNYKTAPSIQIGQDKIGVGFRGVGVIEADPGVAGFIETIPGEPTAAFSPTSADTFGLSNQLTDNKILYLSSPLVLNTAATAPTPVPNDYRQMVVQSVVGVKKGDIVTARGSQAPPPFGDPKSIVRVVGITSATTSAGVSTHTVLLSKPWIPVPGQTYQVQFRRDWSMATASATYDQSANRFSAVFPLATRTGVGAGAEATLTFSPKASGYGLGQVAYPGFSTPPGQGPRFAYKQVQWDTYGAYTNDYWQGEATLTDERAKESQLREYVGLQASGRQFVYGYTGPTGKRGGKRGDVYWPDYSEISIWVCVGRHNSDIANWKRIDAPVFDNDTAQPYCLVTLEPALKGIGEPPSVRRKLKNQPKQNSPGFDSAKQRGKQPNVPYSKSATAQAPVIRINLRRCPDAWVTNYVNADGNYNLPNWLKNEQTQPVGEYFNGKSAWWHSGGLTPRPVVDFRMSTGSAGIDSGTIEIVNPGSGWEKDCLFAFRIYQANPYDQIEDFNFKKRASSVVTTGRRVNRNRAHRAFSSTARYSEFVMRANSADTTQAPGPPAEIVGFPTVDVSGQDYRAGDVAALMLLRRPTGGDFETKVASFYGFVAAQGSSTEFTYDTTTIPNATYARTAASKTVTVTTTNPHGLTPGDRVRLDFTSGTAQDGDYNIVSVPSATTFTVAHDFAGTASGTVTITGLSFWPRQNTGADVHVVSVASSTILAAARSRNVLKCATSEVLLDFSQVIVADTSGGLARLRLDKMSYPENHLTATPTYDVANVNTTYNGLPATQLNNVQMYSPASSAGTSIATALQPGQWVYLGDTSIQPRLTQIVSVTPNENTGSAWQQTATVLVSGAASSAANSLTMRFAYAFDLYAGASQSQTVEWRASQVVNGDGSNRVTGVRILNSGRNYFAAPEISFRGGGLGYGLEVRADVSDGKVTGLTVVDPGRGWTAPPELYTPDGPASAVPVMRPAMRGKYRCAYRFVDRSETVVATVNITAVEGEDAVRVTVNDATSIKPGMLLDSARVPLSTRVVGVSGNQLTLSAPATGEGLLARVIVEAGGSGYASGEIVTVTLPALKPDGYVGNWPTPTATFTPAVLEPDGSGGFQVASAAVNNPGTNLYPTGQIPVQFSPPAGGGAAATGYACISAFSTASSYDKSAVIRDMEKPVSYSDFSPIVDVDAGPNDQREHANKLVWTLPGVKPPARADMVEFYRTSADQSLVYYRLDMYGVPTEDGVQVVGDDTLTDEQLFDPDRANYAAVPVVLPNGSLNAYRFGQPRTDMSACVAFQDRLWYGVSTSGLADNTIFYSEYDEFESCPEANELPIQNNYRTTDSLTALAPFGSMLLAMQSSHTYAVTYNSDPNTDATIQMISHRGCLNQRCWDVHENILYAVDESGIYSMTRGGEVENLSLPIRDYFSQELLAFDRRETFHLKVCERTKVLRFFCTLASDPTATPSVAFCYHLTQKTWWSEQYPNSICSAVSGRPTPTRVSSTLYGAVDGNIYELTGTSDSAYRTVTGVTITNPGAGYTEAPKITSAAGSGAVFQGVVSEGELVDILVLSSGWGYFQGERMLTEAGDYLVTEDGRKIVGGTETPIDLVIEPPPFAGPSLLAEDGRLLLTEQGGRLRQGDDNPATATATVSVPQEYVTTGTFTRSLDENAVCVITSVASTTGISPGMEVASPYLPLGCVVRSVFGNNVTVEFMDGTNVQALNSATTGEVRFYKPFLTSVPFLLSTGNMELANEANVPRNGSALIDRSVTVVYDTTESDKFVELLEYYNASSSPRANILRRNRGGPGGFSHQQDSASTSLNTSRYASHLAAATGVAKATFAGRSNEDATGTDRHVRVELFGRVNPANGQPGELVPQQLRIHSLTIEGVVENAQRS